MRKLLAILAILLFVGIAFAQWTLEPPGGDYADFEIQYEYPDTSGGGPVWHLWAARHVPKDNNGDWPGNHNVYVATFTEDPGYWPNNEYVQLHVPLAKVPVEFWCNGSEEPQPDIDPSYAKRLTWPDGLPLPTPAIGDLAMGTDFVLYAQNTCKVRVAEEGIPSGVLSNLHTRWPDDYGHHSYRVYFTKEFPPDTPTPLPTDTPEPTPTNTPIPTDTPEPTVTPTPGPIPCPGPAAFLLLLIPALCVKLFS